MIEKIPKIPQKIIEAVNENKLAVFIGAGVSRLIGCEGWDQLASSLVEKCFCLGLINYKEKEILLQSNNYKKTITVCYFLLREKKHEKEFYRQFKKSLSANETLLKKIKIYDELFRLRALFITTNADVYFDKYFEPTRIFFEEDDFDVSNVDRNKLYKIHGSIGNGSKKKYRDSLIFTVPQYIKRYNIFNFKMFLKHIFDKYTVLFVGYGLEEFELLDFLTTKFDPKKDEELKHFILIPLYRGEENILKFEKYYYNSMGIEVIAYEKDERGYEQLYEVIKKWNKEINRSTTYLNDSFIQISNAIENFSKGSAENVFQLIRNDAAQENYFFHQLAKSYNPFPWLVPLKEKGYFSPERNPRPYEIPDNKGCYDIPHWNVLDYLESVAKKNAENPDNEISSVLLEIVNEIINYRDKEGKRIENYRTDWVMIKIIFSLPIKMISKKHIEFIKVALNSKWNTNLISSEIDESVLPKLLEEKDKNLLLKLLDVIFSFRKKGKSDEFTSIMDEYYLTQVLKKYKPSIARLCAIEAAEVAIKKMESIIKKDKSQFNDIWIPTIEDSSQTLFPGRYECQLVYFVRDMYKHSKPDEIKKEIESLLNKKHPIFKRIAIHIINFHYKDLSELFWNWKGNPLEEDSLKHELYELFKNKSASFIEEQIEKIIKWIEEKRYSGSEEVVAYYKKEWLSSLIETGDKKVIELYEKYHKINPGKLRYPGLNFIIGRESKIKSPIQFERLCSLENSEIVNFLNKRNEIESKLLRTFTHCVEEKPEKFTDNLKPFLKVKPFYQHALLQGFKESFKSGKDLDLEAVFDFIFNLIKENNFWDEKYKGNNYRDYIISHIGEFIENVINCRYCSLKINLLKKLKEILLLLVKRTESQISDINSPYLFLEIENSPKGKVLSATLNLLLRLARLYEENREEKQIKKIIKEIEEEINRKLKSKDYSIEFSMILGKHLTDLFKFDKNWVKENINKIFPKDSKDHWIAAMTGYLLLSRSGISKEVYFLLKKNNHYLEAINCKDFSDQLTVEKFVQHICLGFIHDWEKLEDENSLIYKLFEHNDPSQLLEIVNYFTYLGGQNKPGNQMELKIKLLWKKLYELIKENEKQEEYKKIASNLSKWLYLIDEINEETFKWIKLSAKYVDRDFNIQNLINGLVKHLEKAPGKVGYILLEMLEHNIFPELKEQIQQIVSYLYESSEKEIANKICNMYGEKGYFFLKTLYEKYNI